MSQKGGIVLILLIIVVIIGLLIGAFLITQKTNLFPQASNKASSQTSSDEPDVALKTQYENPFDEKTSYENPFENYQNPFDNL